MQILLCVEHISSKLEWNLCVGFSADSHLPSAFGNDILLTSQVGNIQDHTDESGVCFADTVQQSKEKDDVDGNSNSDDDDDSGLYQVPPPAKPVDNDLPKNYQYTVST